MILDNEMIIDSNFTGVLPKGNLTHSELDKSYFMRKI